MSDKPMISKATKDVLSNVRKIVPPLLEKFHKGISPNCSLGTMKMLTILQVYWDGWQSLEEVKSEFVKIQAIAA